MHVSAKTGISPQEVRTRFALVAPAGDDQAQASAALVYDAGRTPPKFSLRGVAVTPPAAAEVSIFESPTGSDVVLRLMWGPLPAPFPRALAATGILLGMAIAYISEWSAGGGISALLIALMPVAMLLYQRKGERHIQSRLGEVLGGVQFVPRPH